VSINKQVLIALVLSCSFISVAQADKPNDEGTRSESFWSGWFSRTESKNATQEVKAKSKKESSRKATSTKLFSDKERSDIQRYYQRDDDKISKKKGNKGKNKNSKNKDNKGNNKNTKKALPHGLQKKLARDGQLPPGWQNKVVRGEVLDGDILKQSTYLPSELSRRLPTLEEGVEIRRVGDKVVRVLEGNGTIIDVIDLADILLPQ